MTTQPQKTIQELTYALTDEQRLCAEMLVNAEYNRAMKLEFKTTAEIGAEVGVTRQTISAWKRKPPFAEYMAYLSKLHTDSMRPFVDAQLMALIKGGNNGLASIKAIELWYKVNQILVSRSESVYIDATAPKLSQEEISEGIAELAKKLQDSGGN